MKHIVFGLALGLGLFPLHSASAATNVAVDVRRGFGEYASASSSSDPALAGAPVVSAVAYQNVAGGAANAKAGPLCGFPNACAAPSPEGGLGLARAEANGAQGALRVRASVTGEPTFAPGEDFPAVGGDAGALAGLTDTLTFTGDQALFEFDIDYETALSGLGATSLSFGFGVDQGAQLANFEIVRVRDVEGLKQYYRLWNDGFVVEQGDVLPSVFEGGVSRPGFRFSYDYTPWLGALTDNTQNFRWSLGAYSRLDDEGVARMAADHSLFIKVAGATSANGYSYLGRPVGSAVPEPATWAMMLMGFLGLGAAVRARRRGAVVR